MHARRPEPDASRPASAASYRAVPSPAGDAMLDDVVQRLAGHPAVQGVALCGSARDAALTRVSDIDLLLVVDEAHEDLRSGVTCIGGRMGDLLFATTGEISEIANAESALDAATWIGMLASHLERADILFDRHGALAMAQAQIRRCELASSAEPGAAYRAWNKINYDRQHNRRMLESDDPDYAAALDVRLLYGLVDVFTGYFATRGLRWQGEKAAVRYLREHDPEFLALFQQAHSENDRRAKFDLYEQLCQQATAPVGGLWPDGATSAHLRNLAAASTEVHTEATAFIASLFEDG